MVNYWGTYISKRLKDIWEDSDTFLAEYKASPVYANNSKISDTSATVLYSLLLSEYAESPISSNNEDMFKLQIFTTIFEYGPTWEKKLDIQNKLRSITDSDLTLGSTTIYNHAIAPGSYESGTGEFDYINDQNTTKRVNSPLDKYAQLYSVLVTDVTREFLSHFKRFFRQFVAYDRPFIYSSEDSDD